MKLTILRHARASGVERFLKESKLYRAILRGREFEKIINQELNKLGLTFDQAIVLVSVFRSLGTGRHD